MGLNATGVSVSIDQVSVAPSCSTAPLTMLCRLQHGDSFSSPYIDGMPANVRQVFSKARQRRPKSFADTVAVCHSEPGVQPLPRPDALLRTIRVYMFLRCVASSHVFHVALPARRRVVLDWPHNVRGSACSHVPSACISCSLAMVLLSQTDRLPFGWEKRMNKLDEIWVPTKYVPWACSRSWIVNSC